MKIIRGILLNHLTLSSCLKTIQPMLPASVILLPHILLRKLSQRELRLLVQLPLSMQFSQLLVL